MTNFGKSFSALRSAAVVSFGLLSATGFTSTAIAQDSWTIKWTSYGPQSGVFGESMAQWIDLVETGTEGRVKVQPFYLGALCSVLDGLACAKDGRADMAFISQQFYPAEFPLANVITIPFVAADPEAQTRLIQEMAVEPGAFRDEIEAQGIHHLFFIPGTSAVIGSKEPAESIAWLDRKSVRGTARFLRALELVGANPVSIPITDIYEGIDRGVVDAWSGTGFEAVQSYKLGEVTPHIAETHSGGFISGSAVINKGLWDSFPADVQQVITEASIAVFENQLGDAQSRLWTEACESAAEDGVQLTVWSEERRKEWADAVVDTLRAEWQSEAASRTDVDLDAFWADYIVRLEDKTDPNYVGPVQFCIDSGIL